MKFRTPRILSAGLLFLAGLTSLSLSSCCQKAQLPQPEQVLQTATHVNRYFMDKYADVSADSFVRGKYRPSHIWTRSVYYEGLMELYSIDPKDEYLNYALDWGACHDWGLHRGITTRNADNQCAGQTYLTLYNMKGDTAMIRDIKACMQMLKDSPDLGDWTWIDAIQMAMPILAQMGAIENDPGYWEKAYDMYMYTRNEIGKSEANPQYGLWNPKDGLWWRDADFCPPYTEPNGEDCYWGRGNGWVLVALVRYMDRTPENEAHRQQYIDDFKAMAKAIKACQREDGFWNCSLHDPDHFGGPETTSTALFTCGLAWGIRNGLLSEKAYLPVVAKSWQALQSTVHENGFIGHIQGTGKEPKDSQPSGYDIEPDFEDFAWGCFLLACAEVYRLLI